MRGVPISAWRMSALLDSCCASRLTCYYYHNFCCRKVTSSGEGAGVIASSEEELKDIRLPFRIVAPPFFNLVIVRAIGRFPSTVVPISTHTLSTNAVHALLGYQ